MDLNSLLKYYCLLLTGVFVYSAELPSYQSSTSEQEAQVDDDFNAEITGRFTDITSEPEQNPECVPDHTQVKELQVCLQI